MRSLNKVKVWLAVLDLEEDKNKSMANDNIQANSEKKVVIELDNVRRDFLVGEETVHALKV